MKEALLIEKEIFKYLILIKKLKTELEFENYFKEIIYYDSTVNYMKIIEEMKSDEDDEMSSVIIGKLLKKVIIFMGQLEKVVKNKENYHEIPIKKWFFMILLIRIALIEVSTYHSMLVNISISKSDFTHGRITSQSQSQSNSIYEYIIDYKSVNAFFIFTFIPKIIEYIVYIHYDSHSLTEIEIENGNDNDCSDVNLTNNILTSIINSSIDYINTYHSVYFAFLSEYEDINFNKNDKNTQKKLDFLEFYIEISPFLSISQLNLHLNINKTNHSHHITNQSLALNDYEDLYVNIICAFYIKSYSSSFLSLIHKTYRESTNSNGIPSKNSLIIEIFLRKSQIYDIFSYQNIEIQIIHDYIHSQCYQSSQITHSNIEKRGLLSLSYESDLYIKEILYEVNLTELYLPSKTITSLSSFQKRPKNLIDMSIMIINTGKSYKNQEISMNSSKNQLSYEKMIESIKIIPYNELTFSHIISYSVLSLYILLDIQYYEKILQSLKSISISSYINASFEFICEVMKRIVFSFAFSFDFSKKSKENEENHENTYFYIKKYVTRAIYLNKEIINHLLSDCFSYLLVKTLISHFDSCHFLIISMENSQIPVLKRLFLYSKWVYKYPIEDYFSIGDAILNEIMTLGVKSLINISNEKEKEDFKKEVLFFGRLEFFQSCFDCFVGFDIDFCQFTSISVTENDYLILSVIDCLLSIQFVYSGLFIKVYQLVLSLKKDVVNEFSMVRYVLEQVIRKLNGSSSEFGGTNRKSLVSNCDIVFL